MIIVATIEIATKTIPTITKEEKPLKQPKTIVNASNRAKKDKDIAKNFIYSPQKQLIISFF